MSAKSTAKTIFINDEEYRFKKTKTILNAATSVGIKIPTLCHLAELTPTGSCRMCVVEVEGMPRPIPACSTAIKQGMKIWTNSPKIQQVRRTLLELIVANHPLDCLYCVQNGACELQELCKIYGIRDHNYLGEKRSNPMDVTSTGLVRDPDKCILCGRCVKMCDEVQALHAIDFTNRGFHTIISSAFNRPISESSCVQCGQCVRVCPTGALKERSSNKEVEDAIQNPNLRTIVQIAPSISVTIGEAFGLEPGHDITPKLITGLRRLGFEAVFDTVFGADLTIMEEANELVKRITNAETLPMISTCCPAWIKFMEQDYADMIPHMSTCKSPMSMQGAIIKSYWAKNQKIDPNKIFQVAIMPCTAKKYEAERPELVNDGYPNTDAVLTTRELIRLFRSRGLDLLKLPDGKYDNPLGESTGAGKIFGAAGGVMEAALRTGYWMVNNKNLEDVNITAVRGVEGIKKTTVQLTPELSINCVAVSGLKNARKICDEILEGNPNNYQFIEIMACPGGCINGGGQPRGLELKTLQARAKALYTLDGEYKKRFSHENSDVQRLYSSFLKKLGGHEAHHLLHTRYYPNREQEEL